MKNHNNNKPAQARKENLYVRTDLFSYTIMKESDNEWYKLKYYKMKD